MIRSIRNHLLLALAFLPVLAIAASAAISNIAGFVTQADGNTVTAALWNSQIGAIYTYINTNLVSTLNLLDTKGDILTYDGSNHVVLSTGGAANDGKVPVADSTQPAGWRIGDIGSVTDLTTKGDILAYDGSNNVRHPVGTDGYILTARSTATNGIAWEAPTAVPQGMIAMWSGTISSIPSGWALCDGATHSGVATPNLQGLFVVGAGNVSPGATGGMGLMNPGGPYGDNSAGAGLGPSHTHTVSMSATGLTAGGITLYTGASSAATTSGAKTITPKYYALAFIMKL